MGPCTWHSQLAWQYHSSPPTHSAFHHLSRAAHPAGTSRSLSRHDHKRQERREKWTLSAHWTSRTPPIALGRCSGPVHLAQAASLISLHLLIPKGSEMKPPGHHAQLVPGFPKAYLGKHPGGWGSGLRPCQSTNCSLWLLSVGLPQGAGEGGHCPPLINLRLCYLPLSCHSISLTLHLYHALAECLQDILLETQHQEM